MPGSRFLHLTLSSPSVMSTVNVTNSVEVYAYHSSTLLITYGVSVAAALLANIMGLAAFHYNEIVMDRSFSSIASATQHTSLVPEEHHEPRGSVIQRLVGERKVLFKKLDSGGYGIIVLG
jgi:hypothetical protein